MTFPFAVTRSSLLFLTLLAIVGGATALAVQRWPQLDNTVFPPMFWGIPAALIYDIVTRPLISAGRMPEMPMAFRAIGVVVFGLSYLALSGAPASP